MSEQYTYESFVAQYGFPPQEFFNREVQSVAAGAAIPDFEKQLAVAEANAAKTAGWETSGNTETEATGANNDTIVGNLKEIIAGRKWHQAFAQEFLAGTLKDYGPYCGSTCQQLIKAGLIDTTLVPA